MNDETSVRSNFANIPVAIRVSRKAGKANLLLAARAYAVSFSSRTSRVFERATAEDRHIAEAVGYLSYSGHYLCVERGPL